MKFAQRSSKKLIHAAITLFAVGITSDAMASAFQLLELNATNTGNYGAGVAAEAADASISFYNPAGLVYLQHDQVVGSLNTIFASSEFTGSDTWNTFPPDVNPLVHPLTLTAENLQGGGTFLIPAVYYAHSFSDNFAFGLSVNSPFGLTTEWGNDSAVRYAATTTDLKVYDVSPAIGGRLTDKLSIGAGLDLEYSTVSFDLVAGIPGFNTLIFPDPFSHDATANNDAHAFGVGAHVGLMYQATAATRVGINYASEVEMHYTGVSQTGQQIYINHQAFVSDGLSSDSTMPANTTVSIFHVVNPQWSLLGTVMYTQWSSIKDIVLKNAAGVSPVLTPEIIVIDSPQNFKDTWRASVGANYRVNEKLMVRFGGGFDESPTNDVDRNLRLPEGDRIGLAIGLHYQFLPTIAVDLGYNHLFIEDGDINNTSITGRQQATVVGTSENRADIVGLQLTWNVT